MTTNNTINNTLPSSWTMLGTAANSILYASSANTISAIASANNALLSTNGSGVPSISTTLPSGITFVLPLIQGITNASNAAAGNVGELITSVVPLASAITLSNNIIANITTVSLTAGDWDVWANFGTTFTGTATYTSGWINTSSVTQPDVSLISAWGHVTINGSGFTVPYQRMSLSGTTTIYLSTKVNFSTGASTACGGIYARRIR
jgi:hypothetical protein